MRRRRPRAIFLAALCVAAGVTCSDRNATSPSSGLLSRIGFAPALTAAATEIYRNLVAFGLDLDDVRLQLKRQNGEIVKDTIIALGAEQDEVRIELTIQLRSAEEHLLAVVELRGGTEVLFAGSQEIIARPGPSGRDTPPVEVTYVGPGATAALLAVTPSDSAIFTTDSIDFVATALDASEQSVPVVAVAWSVENPSLGTISPSGRFKPSQTRGETNVTAKLPTGLTASAHVSIAPLPTQVSVVSGASQIGTVGSALAQPVVVEVRAADNLPVPGVQVAFAVSGGGSSLSASSATTDATGRASTLPTLGTAVGQNTISVTAANVPAITVSATGKAGKATKLSILQQPSASAITGVPLAVQPKLKLLDVYGNVVRAAGVAVHATPTMTSGSQLGGSVTALTDATGVAVFTDLALTGPSGTTALVFAQDTLGSATSTNITVGLGAPAALVLNGSATLNGVAGASLAGAPSLIVKDSAGNHVPGVSVRLTVTGSGATLYDETHPTDAAGNVSLGVIPVPTVAGSYQITAASGSLTGSPIQVALSAVHADASKLAFITQPTGTAGVTGGLLTPIVVELRDPFGNRVTTGATSQETITLSLAGGTTGAVLGPSPSAVTQTALNGRATFNVSVDLAGTGYTLGASAGATITSITSSPFDITSSGSARLLVVSGGEQGVLPGNALPDSIVVRAFDGSQNPMAFTTVTFTIDSGGGTLNDLPSPVQVTTDANGMAGVAWTVATGEHLLTASMSGASEKVRAYVADRLVMVTEPSIDPQSGITLVRQPQVRFTDAVGRLIRAGQQFVQAQLLRADLGPASGNLQFSAASTDADGVATFTQLSITGSVSEPVLLRFLHNKNGENPAIAAVLSDTITLRPGLASVIAVEGSTDRHRVDPAGSISLRFRVTDGINLVSSEPVDVSMIQGAASCAASSVVTSDAFGIATVDVTAGSAFTSCRALVQLRRSVPNGDPVSWQNVYAVAPTVPLWVGGTDKDPDPWGWSVRGNWHGGLEPVGQGFVFIPGAVDFWPRVDAALMLESLDIEKGATVDLKGNVLTVSGSLVGGGWLTNTGAVLLTATRDGTLRAQVDGPVRIGEKDKTACAPGDRAYTVASIFTAGSLELNCGLEIDGGAIVTVLGDLVVQSAGGSFTQNSGATSVGRDATFISGDSRLVSETFSVAGKLSVGPNARFDQQKGAITVDGDASFDGRSDFSEGFLVVKGSLLHNGDGDNRRFVASNNHVTQLGADKEDKTITWNVPVENRTSRLGRLVIQDRTPTGYRFTNADERLAIVDLDDLFVATGAQLSVPNFFTINAGGIPGLGVRVDKDGRFMNEGQVIVLNGDQCGELIKGLIPAPFSCVTK
jgi:hypothetical protein